MGTQSELVIITEPIASIAAFAQTPCSNRLSVSSRRQEGDMILVDPPCGVRIDGHATGNGATHYREFAMGCGEMTEPEFVAFLTTALSLLARNSKSGSVHFIFMSWHHLHELLSAGKQVYDSLLNLVVWIKTRLAWDRCSVLSMSFAPSFVTVRIRTATTFSLAGLVATGRTSGPIPP